MGDRSWFRNFAFFVLVLVGVVAFALLQGPPRSMPRNQEIDQPVAARTGGVVGAARDANRGGATGAERDADRGGATGAEHEASASHASAGALPLDVSIQLEAGEFEIVPVATGGAIHVQADYDEALHRLEHEFVPDAAHGNRFRLSFTAHGSWRHVRRAVNDVTGRDAEGRGHRRSHSLPTRVRVELPVGVPMNLELDVGKGSTRIDLTGLTLHRLVLDHSMGDTDLVLEQPNPVEMEALDVRGKMGDLTISGLGNAHARRFDFSGQMGSYELDFDGDWQVDLEGAITVTMGNAEVDFPAGLQVDLTNRHVVFGGLETSASRTTRDPEAPGHAHTATLQTAVHFGNLVIR